MMRFLNICVIAALVLAAAACLQDQVRVDAAGRARRKAAPGDPAGARRDRGAARGMGKARQSGAHPGVWRSATWRLQPIDARQFDPFDHLPERPPELVPPDEPDPIGARDRQSRPDRPHANRKPATDVEARHRECKSAGIQTMNAPDAHDGPRLRDRGAIAGRREGALAPPCDADAALRPGCRPRRQGAGARRARDARVRPRLCGDRRPARHVRGHSGAAT